MDDLLEFLNRPLCIIETVETDEEPGEATEEQKKYWEERSKKIYEQCEKDDRERMDGTRESAFEEWLRNKNSG